MMFVHGGGGLWQRLRLFWSPQLAQKKEQGAKLMDIVAGSDKRTTVFKEA